MFAHIDRYGEVWARRLLTGRFDDLVTRLSGLGHLNLGYIPWGQAWGQLLAPGEAMGGGW